MNTEHDALGRWASTGQGSSSSKEGTPLKTWADARKSRGESADYYNAPFADGSTLHQAKFGKLRAVGYSKPGASPDTWDVIRSAHGAVKSPKKVTVTLEDLRAGKHFTDSRALAHTIRGGLQGKFD